MDFAAQRIVFSTHVGGWRDFDLPYFIRELTGATTVMGNDANAGAIGEARYGAGPIPMVERSAISRFAPMARKDARRR